jgi:hypothetical protein
VLFVYFDNSQVDCLAWVDLLSLSLADCYPAGVELLVKRVYGSVPPLAL